MIGLMKCWRRWRAWLDRRLNYRQDNGSSPLAEVGERLAAAKPKDMADIDLNAYRGLHEPWNDWNHIRQCGRRWATILARIVLENEP